MKRAKNVMLLWWFGVMIGSSAAFEGTDRELFPVPDVIRPNIEFWKKIYAVYPTSKVLIHDINNLGLIYEVVDLDEFGEGLSHKQRWRQVDEIKDEYRGLLNLLAQRRLQEDGSNPRAARVMEIFGKHAPPAALREAAKSVRAQLGLKDRFRTGLERSGLYLDHIVEVLEEYELPRELIVMPHVESSFNAKAYSKVGAAGLWQFTRYTGRLFLTINYEVDERMDPLKATVAAAKLLKKNYEELGSWPLAITAYNHGTNGMKRAKKQFGHDFGKIYREYKSRTFGFASRNFYAEFLAALEVVENYRSYFGEVEFHQPEEYIEFELDQYVTVKTLLEYSNLDVESFARFNPALRPPVLSSKRRIPPGYSIRLPAASSVTAGELVAKIAPDAMYSKQVETDWYRIRRGDNLSSISRRLGVSVDQLAEYNNISKRQTLYAGRTLRIPPKDAGVKPLPVVEEKPQLASVDATKLEEDKVISRSQWDLIARKLNSPGKVTTAPEPPAEVEGKLQDDLLAVEAEITLSREEREAIITYDFDSLEQPKVEATYASLNTAVDVMYDVPATPVGVVSEWIIVEPEETLGHYADWLGLSTQRLRDLNGLSYNREIQIGQRIKLDYSQVGYAEFERRRSEFHQMKEEDFFSTYQVDRLQPHRVKSGETIWQICNSIYDVPVWLVAKYNPDKDLSQLGRNDQLLMPIVVAIDPARTPAIATQE